MSSNKPGQRGNQRQNNKEESIGNQQGTSQTGAQNGGGRRRQSEPGEGTRTTKGKNPRGTNRSDR
jgi:hypothetical protein